MTKTVKKVVKKTTPKEDGYKVTIKVGGKLYSASGKTSLEAISNLVVRNGKGTAIITMEHAGMKKERVLMPMIVQRLFNTHGISREIAIKNASVTF